MDNSNLFSHPDEPETVASGEAPGKPVEYPMFRIDPAPTLPSLQRNARQRHPGTWRCARPVRPLWLASWAATSTVHGGHIQRRWQVNCPSWSGLAPPSRRDRRHHKLVANRCGARSGLDRSRRQVDARLVPATPTFDGDRRHSWPREAPGFRMLWRT
jgi:hypothetical protein